MIELNPDDVARWCKGEWDVHPVLPFAGVSKDSRTIKKGDLYFALKGDKFDGHDFVNEALARGAYGAVVKKSWNPSGKKTMPVLRVNDPLVALQSAASNYRAKMKALIIGVTGSCGKTTVKEMVAQILSQTAKVAKNTGNYNNHIGLPISILSADISAQYGVFEVGVNHPGEMEVLCDILKPDWGIVNNIAPVHIEFFKTEKNIAIEKKKLLLALSPRGLGFIDGDSSFALFLSEKVPVPCIRIGTVSYTHLTLPTIYSV